LFFQDQSSKSCHRKSHVVPHTRRQVSPHLRDQTDKIADIVVAIFADYREAGSAIIRLIDVGFGTASISMVGREFSQRTPGAPAERTAPLRYGNNRGTFWSEMESQLFDAHFVSAEPAVPIVALGYLAKRAADFTDGTGASMTRLGAALCGIGIPTDHVVRYEFAVHANGCLVMAHGEGLDIARARTVLRYATPASVDVHAVRPAPRALPLLPEPDRVVSEAAAALR
jgi:hypothetical protein